MFGKVYIVPFISVESVSSAGGRSALTPAPLVPPVRRHALQKVRQDAPIAKIAGLATPKASPGNPSLGTPPGCLLKDRFPVPSEAFPQARRRWQRSRVFNPAPLPC